MAQHKRTYLKLLGVLFLGLSASWLLGPGWNHLLHSTSNLISEYEANGMRAATLFRTCDALAAVALITGVLFNRQTIQRRFGRYMPWAIIAAAGLMLVDTVLPVHCSLANGVCTPQMVPISVIHGIESAILATTVFVASIYAAIWRKFGWWFVIVQVASFFLGIIFKHLAPHWLLLIQMTYQILQAYWLYQIVFREPTQARVIIGSQLVVRKIVAVWIGLNGLASVVSAWHRLTFGHLMEPFIFTNDTAWLLSHTLLVGLLLLYFARQLWLGEHRAFVITNIVLLSVVLRDVFLPHSALLILTYGLTLLLMIYSETAFDRRGNFAGATSRLRFIVGGLAVIGLVATIGTTGFRLHDKAAWQKSSIDGIQAVRHVALLQISADKDDPRRIRVFYRLLDVLGGATYGWIALSIFLPKSLFKNSRSLVDTNDMETALNHWSRSSEDFFKLWPTDKTYYHTARGSLIAYRQEGDIVLALADPIGAPERLALDLAEFLQHCKDHGLKLAWLMVNEINRQAYETAGFKAFQIGSSAVVDIANFSQDTVRNKWWRWQMNRGSRLGYSYEQSLPPHRLELIDEVRQVSDAWLAQRGYGEESFAMGYFDENYLQSCRLHCLRDDQGHLIAFTNELPIFAGQLQTTVDLIRFLPDQDGTMQVLLAHTITQLANAGRFKYFDLGLVPLASVDSRLARIVARLGRNRFSTTGLEQFKNKFEPDWQPNYICYDGDPVDFARVLIALGRVMAMPKKTGDHDAT